MWGGNIYSSPTTQLDDELSSTSINAVQNKVIKAELDKKVVLTGDNTLNGNNVFAEGLTEFDGQVAFNGQTEFNGTLDFNVKEIQINSDTTFNHPVVNNETVITYGEQTNQSKIIMNGGLQVNSITESGTKTLLDMGEGETITYKGSELAKTGDYIENTSTDGSSQAVWNERALTVEEVTIDEDHATTEIVPGEIVLTATGQYTMNMRADTENPCIVVNDTNGEHSLTLGTKLQYGLTSADELDNIATEKYVDDALKNAGSSSSIDEQSLIILLCGGNTIRIGTDKADWVIKGTTAYYVYADDSVTSSDKAAACDLTSYKILKTVCGNGSITIYYPNTNIPDDGVGLLIKY